MYGAKIDNLMRLKKAGVNVPAFTVVPYEDAVREDLQVELPSDGKLFSVRSSANVEDSDSASFAGQFDTYLNVPAGEVKQKIKDIVSSLDGDNVKAYAAKNNIDVQDIKMNVIVQDMIDSDISGVVFTANPQGLLNETVITAGRGLGEGVVSSRVDTTSYYYNFTDKVYYYEGKEDLLPPELFDNLIGIIDGIKNMFGMFLDVEFAIKDNTVYILQVRSITTMDRDKENMFDNSNIVESYPGISLPLTTSFVDLVYSGVFRGLSARVLKNDKELAKREDIFLNMTGHVNGRVYYKIGNWYSVLEFLPFHKKIIPVWEEMLGIKSSAKHVDTVKIGPFVRIATYFNSFHELKNAPKNVSDLNKTFISINDDFYKKFDPSMTPAELVSLFNDIRVRLFACWDVTLLNDMYSFIYTGLLKSRLKKKYKKTDKEINTYISNFSELESMKPILSMIRLALDKDDYSEEEFAEEKREYIKLYGDRNLEELKLESRTFRTNPELLDKKIEEYREDIPGLKQTLKDMMDSRRVSESYDRIVRSYVKKAGIGIFFREQSRLNRSRIYGMVRLLIDTLGMRYKEMGLIDDAFDVYYLEINEVLKLASAPADMKKAVAERKEQYELYRELPAYSRLIFQGKEFNKNHVSVNSYHKRLKENELQGTPCSGGVCEGEALVISNVNDTGDIKGKILITKMTDPGWVFLLASAKGVISEKGSLLSHTAIISREMGVPSIVGVKDLLDYIQTGDRIRMDGDTGKIEIISRGDNK